MHPSVHCSTIYNSQDTEATKTSINRGVDKEDVVHVYTMDYHSSMKRNEIRSFVEDVAGPSVCQTD